MSCSLLEHVPENGKVLDLGCGSGRDTKALSALGLAVTPLDGSLEMVKRAEALTGLDVIHMDFKDIDFKNTFHGIFSCASLLHVPFEELPAILKKLHTALKDNGVLYMSFKYGAFEGERNGRYFTDLTRESLTALLKDLPFTGVTTWETADIREGRNSEKWLNTIVRKA